MSGCVHRSLTIRTTPPGAQVYVNDQLQGNTPLTYDFLWYGWHRITLRKEGFVRQDDLRLLRAPAYLWIPFDLAAELLPFPVRDERALDYTLTPAEPPPAPTPPVILDSSVEEQRHATPASPPTDEAGAAKAPATEEPPRAAPKSAE